MQPEPGALLAEEVGRNLSKRSYELCKILGDGERLTVRGGGSEGSVARRIDCLGNTVRVELRKNVIMDQSRYTLGRGIGFSISLVPAIKGDRSLLLLLRVLFGLPVGPN